MKNLALVFIAFIALASCEVSFSKRFKAVASSPPKGRQDIGNFFEGFFGHFNLSKPSQILDCFCDFNAGLLLKKLYDVNELLEDVNADHVLKVHLDWAKLIWDDSSLQSTHACIAMTQDFTDLLNALDIKERNPRLFALAKFLYYQAHYPQLLQDFTPVIANLDKKDFNAAGDAFGSVINNLVDATKEEGLSHLAYAGFKNGEALHFNLDMPSDSLQCFDRNTSEIFLDFLYKLSVAVTNGSFIDAPLNTHTFWETTGKDLLSQIPDSAWECQKNSKDNQELTNKLGINVESKEFWQLFNKYVEKRRLGYYSHLKTLKHTLENVNFIHAGSVYGHLLAAAVKK